MDLTAFRATLGDIPVQDNPRLVQQKSRDHYFYSPILKAKLDHVVGDLVVSPRTQDEVVTVLRAAFAHDVPVTPRGAGTGNYGQAMPLSGGVVLDLVNLNRVVSISKERVRAESGIIIEKLDEATREAVGGELRFHPSTYRMATLGGFIAGGSGGVGSVRWGGLRSFGNILGLKVITCEAEPRKLEFAGPETLKVAHAYGTNGIIVEAEMPLAAAYDWVDFMAGFDSFIEACAFGQAVAQQDGLLLKEVAPIAAPVPWDYFNRHRPFMDNRDQSVVCMMVAPFAVDDVQTLLDLWKGKALYRGDKVDEETRRKVPPQYELAWNHTTLRALKVDENITYLQTQYPDLETVKKITSILGDEMPIHIEMTRFDGRIVFSGLPLIRYAGEARLEEIIHIHEENGCLVFNPHRYTLEEGGMKRTDQGQLDFKREADPHGLLNPGKMIGWENPDFDLNSGRVWLFEGLQPAKVA